MNNFVSDKEAMNVMGNFYRIANCLALDKEEQIINKFLLNTEANISNVKDKEIANFLKTLFFDLKTKYQTVTLDNKKKVAEYFLNSYFLLLNKYKVRA